MVNRGVVSAKEVSVLRAIAIAVAVLLLCATRETAAEDAFANHVDVFPLTASGHYSMLGEVGYHFSIWRVHRRVELGGAGLILDAYDTGDRTDGVNFILTAHVVSIALRDPAKAQKWWPSLGVQCGYNFNRHRMMAVVGFSVGFH